MEWDAVGAIAELMGAIAVLVTVGYLAVQIRQNTLTSESSGLSYLRDLHLLTEQSTQSQRHYIERKLSLFRGKHLSSSERWFG